MSDQITVYEKPTCSTCRQVDKILRESGSAYEKINYYVQPLNKQKLSSLLKKMDMTARELLRKSESAYKEMNLANFEGTDDQLIEMMVKNPDLIQRPIVERGDKAVLGRPPENIRVLLG